MEDEVMKYFGDPEDCQLYKAQQNKDMMSFQADHMFLEDSNSTEQYSQLAQQEPEQQPFQYSFDPFALKFEDNNTSSPDWSDENRCTAGPQFGQYGFLANKQKIFTIHRDEESGETPKTETTEMSKSSKCIQKKKDGCSIKGRKRTFPTVETDSSHSNSREDEVNSINEQVEEEMKKYQHLDEEEKKRMMQMLRNRISAQSSRDRKKIYMTNLEKENTTLKKEIAKLRQDLQQPRQYLPCRFCGRSDNDSPSSEPFLDGRSYTRSTGTGFRNAFTVVSMISLCLIIGIMAPGEWNMQDPTIASMRKYRINQEEITIRDKQYRNLAKMLSPETMYRLENQKLLRKLREMQDALGKVQLETGCEAALRKNTLIEERNSSYAQKAFEERNKSTDPSKKFLDPEPHQMPLFYPEKTESVFCPNGIILDYVKNIEGLKDSHFTGKEAGIGERFQNRTWLQLFVPTKNFSILTKDHSQKFVNIKDEDDGKETKMLELICNIQNAREFSA